MAVSTAMDGEEPFYNVDVNANGVGLITDCTGDSDATAGMSGSADMRVEPDLEKTGCTSASTLQQPHPLTLDEREDLEDQLIAVRDEQLDRDEDPALVDLVYQLMEWLYHADTPTLELAEDAPATIPRLHNLWCGTRHLDLTIDDKRSGRQRRGRHRRRLRHRCTRPRHPCSVHAGVQVREPAQDRATPKRRLSWWCHPPRAR